MSSNLLAVPDFRRLWYVGFIANVVRWLETLAFALFAYGATGSAFVVTALTMLRLLPMGMFGAFLGVAADRVERRSALIGIVIVSMATVLILGVLAAVGGIAIWHLALACFINGICWTADNPVRRIMMGDAVGPERMAAAMSVDIATSNITRVVGPAFSGVLLASFGLAGVFWICLVLYATSLAAALGLNVRHRPERAPQTSFGASMREGFACLRTSDRLIGVFAITVIFNMFAWPILSLVPVIATDHFGLGPQGAGLFASCDGVGGFLGALLIAGLARPAWQGRVYAGGVACYLLLVLAYALAGTVWLAAALLVLIGLVGVGFSVMQTTLVYRFAPVPLRGRMLGLLSMCIGTGPLGFIYLGWLADTFTPRMATLLLAAQGMLVLVLAQRYWRPVLRA
ncbi:MAG: MFS transporter [Burkholderiales bacterium]|nr:MFS transporter [Burkholderiales bacterium]